MSPAHAGLTESWLRGGQRLPGDADPAGRRALRRYAGFVTGTQGTQLGLDVSKPNVARMYDYYLGGKDNFEADRIAAEKVLALVPGLRRAALENRRFLRRVGSQHRH